MIVFRYHLYTLRGFPHAPENQSFGVLVRPAENNGLRLLCTVPWTYNTRCTTVVVHVRRKSSAGLSWVTGFSRAADSFYNWRVPILTLYLVYAMILYCLKTKNKKTKNAQRHSSQLLYCPAGASRHHKLGIL